MIVDHYVWIGPRGFMNPCGHMLGKYVAKFSEVPDDVEIWQSHLGHLRMLANTIGMSVLLSSVPPYLTDIA